MAASSPVSKGDLDQQIDGLFRRQDLLYLEGNAHGRPQHAGAAPKDPRSRRTDSGSGSATSPLVTSRASGTTTTTTTASCTCSKDEFASTGDPMARRASRWVLVTMPFWVARRIHRAQIIDAPGECRYVYVRIGRGEESVFNVDGPGFAKS